MAWYDWFSSIYDTSLEQLYRSARLSAAEHLQLETATRVLDVPAGTGQSLDVLVPRLPSNAELVAIDASTGMLTRAKQRAERNGYANRVQFLVEDAGNLSDIGTFDRLHVFLGLTAMTEYPSVFERLWGLLRPGAIAVVVDVHNARPGLQGHLVNWIARADVRRPVWEPLQRCSEQYERVELPKDARYGGALWLARGRKPLTPRVDAMPLRPEIGPQGAGGGTKISDPAVPTRHS